MNRRGHKGRVDATHKAILDGLRQAGIVAYSIAPVGCGLPDLLIGFQGRNLLMEVKVGKAKLTPAEERFRLTWPGQYATVRTLEEALAVVRR